MHPADSPATAVLDEPTQTAHPYPAWICRPCGIHHGRKQPRLATWHIGTCGVCGTAGPVTEPRDFGHLREEWSNHDC